MKTDRKNEKEKKHGRDKQNNALTFFEASLFYQLINQLIKK